MASNSAELQVKVISRRVETKADAFWFGVLDMFGRVVGLAIGIALVIGLLHIVGVLPVDPSS